MFNSLFEAGYIETEYVYTETDFLKKKKKYSDNDSGIMEWYIAAKTCNHIFH